MHQIDPIHNSCMSQSFENNYFSTLSMCIDITMVGPIQACHQTDCGMPQSALPL